MLGETDNCGPDMLKSLGLEHYAPSRCHGIFWYNPGGNLSSPGAIFEDGEAKRKNSHGHDALAAYSTLSEYHCLGLGYKLPPRPLRNVLSETSVRLSEGRSSLASMQGAAGADLRSRHCGTNIVAEEKGSEEVRNPSMKIENSSSGALLPARMKNPQQTLRISERQLEDICSRLSNGAKEREKRRRERMKGLWRSMMPKLQETGRGEAPSQRQLARVRASSNKVVLSRQEIKK